jgi:geranylgeranyl reductase family protein
VVSSRFDVIVVGGGPAGSIAAFVLARGGARVALIDKAQFPRDKACGDVVGPRALQLLTDLRLPAPKGRDVGEMVVVSPTGRRVQLPCGEGLTYPGHGTAVTRTVFDSTLHEEALAAGATPVQGLADEPLASEGRIEGFRLADGTEVRADFVIGADGATSRVAGAAGLVDAKKVLWGFAIRTYMPQVVDLPAIVFWDSAPFQGFPGYGWVFPGPTGGANVGLGLGTVADRKAGAKVQHALPRFLEHLHEIGLVDDASNSLPAHRLGGWLKMGMIGTVPAAGRVLLVGDAAGLVNPLQGEGIAQALCSGRSAAEALLCEPGRAAARYRAALAVDHLPYHRITAALQGWLIGRPRALALVPRLVVAAGRSDALAGGWSLLWNELLNGAPPGRHRSVAASANHVGRMITAHTAAARWFDATFSDEAAQQVYPNVDPCPTWDTRN